MARVFHAHWLPSGCSYQPQPAHTECSYRLHHYNGRLKIWIWVAYLQVFLTQSELRFSSFLHLLPGWGFANFFHRFTPFKTFVLCHILELNFDHMHIWLRDPLNSPLEAHPIEGLGKDMNVFEVSWGPGGMFRARFFVCLPHSYRVSHHISEFDPGQMHVAVREIRWSPLQRQNRSGGSLRAWDCSNLLCDLGECFAHILLIALPHFSRYSWRFS